MSTIHEDIVQRANTVRAMGAYVGTFDFIVLSEIMHRKVIMHLGEGATDLRDVFAPGLGALGQSESAVHVIGTLMGPHGALLVPVSIGGMPVMNHWVVGVPILGVSLPMLGDSALLVNLMLKRGLSVRKTQAMGDCGIDAWAHALGLPRTASRFKSMRADMATFMVGKAHDELWQNIFRVCQESAVPAPAGKVPAASAKSGSTLPVALAKSGSTLPVVLAKSDLKMCEPMAFAMLPDPVESSSAAPPSDTSVGASAIVASCSGGVSHCPQSSIGASAIVASCSGGVSHCPQPSVGASAIVPFTAEKVVVALACDEKALALAKHVCSFKHHLLTLIGSELSNLTMSYDRFKEAEDFITYICVGACACYVTYFRTWYVLVYKNRWVLRSADCGVVPDF